MKSYILAVVLCFAGVSMLASVASGQENKTEELKPLPDGTVQFNSFNNTPWEPIIREYAKQAGLELNLLCSLPDGTFKFEGNRELTYLEALDFLNENLIPRNRILVRNKHTLNLFDLDEGIPSQMLETISPEELDSRGNYEFLRCRFVVSGLEIANVRNSIEELISTEHRQHITTVEVADLLIIQETVAKLKLFREIIETAQGKLNDWDASFIQLRNALPEDIINAAIPALGLDRNTNTTPDGSLTVTIHAHGDKLIATGHPDMLEKLQRLVDRLDIKLDDPDSGMRPPPYFDVYQVDGDAVLLHEVLQTMLSGRDVNLDVDETKNTIHLRGRDEDHAVAREVIAKTNGGSGNFRVMSIEVLEAEDIIDTIEEMYDLGGVEADENAPSISEISQNRVIIRGNPNQVAEIANMIQKIDVPYQRIPGQRTVIRRIDMNSNELDKTMEMLGGTLPAYDLPNVIDVVVPGESHWRFNRENRAFEIYRGDEILRDADRRRQNGNGNPESGRGEPAEDTDTGRRGGDQSSFFRPGQTIRLNAGRAVPARSSNPQLDLVTYRREINPDLMRQDPAPQEEQETNGDGKTSVEPEDEIESVPGAPVKLFVTSQGLIIQSRDLDAGDLIEDLIMESLGDSAVESLGIQLFLLRFRDAVEAKAQLESYLGISSGGASGGMGDMMSGFLRNAVPGGAGDLVGGLLGGGGSSSGSGIKELAGEVSVVADPKQYSLLVSAVPEDMALIEQLIDLIDQPTAIQNPNPNGRNWLIPLRYVDPLEMEEKIRANLAAILKGSEEGGSSGSGNPQQDMQRQFMRAMLGGRGGGAAGGVEQEAPKASLSVDERNRMLIVTGPEFLYNQINDFVQLVDVAPPVLTRDVIQPQGIDPALLLRILSEDPNVNIVIDEEADTSGAGGASTRSSGNGRTGGTGNNAVMPMNPEMINALRNMQRNRGGGGDRGRGNTRGGGNRGGSSRGGGDRGGRR